MTFFVKDAVFQALVAVEALFCCGRGTGLEGSLLGFEYN